MRVEIKTYWSDLNQAKEFAEDVSKQYPGLKVYLSCCEEKKKSIGGYVETDIRDFPGDEG